MNKSEFIARAASNAPSVPASYKPEFLEYVPPQKHSSDNEMVTRMKNMRSRSEYDAAYEDHKILTWPLFYAEQLALFVESQNPEIFNS